jgi:hypothetical protein
VKKTKLFGLLSSLILSISLTSLPSYALSASYLAAPPSPIEHNVIVTKYLVPLTNFLSAGVGVVVVAMLIVGAIQYSASGGNPQAASAAKKRIFNAILALLIFALAYSFLNFIIPGGLVKL